MVGKRDFPGYENEANSFAYFSTHLSAPHSLKVSILHKICFLKG